MQLGIQPEGSVCANDNKRTMRQIDDIHDTPDQREAQSYRRIETAEEQPVHKYLSKFHVQEVPFIAFPAFPRQVHPCATMGEPAR